MATIIYNIIIRLYGLAIWGLSFFIKDAARWIKLRKMPLDITSKKPGEKRVWVHVSSLGEYEQAKPVLKLIKAQSNTTTVVSFFSVSAFGLNADAVYTDQFCFMPLDTTRNAEEFISKINPDLAVFVKYDFWFNHMQVCEKKDIPALFIAVRLRENHFLVRSNLTFFQNRLQAVTHFFVQDVETKKFLRNKNIHQVTVAGDTRYDRVMTIAAGSKQNKPLVKFLNNEPCIVLGSCWASDLTILLPVIEKTRYRFKWVIVPHKPEQDISSFLVGLSNETIYWNDLESNLEGAAQKRLLVIDRMGLLSTTYAYAKFALIGGAFRGTLHNILEAAVYGIPVFFGKNLNNRKFLEAVELCRAGGAFEFNHPNELIDLIQKMTHDGELYKQAAQVCYEHVRSKSGATKVISATIMDILAE